MNPLPRFLGMALLVVLAALLAALSAPLWNRPPGREASPAAALESAAPTPATRLTRVPQRAALVLAAVAVGLAVLLSFSLTVRPARGADSKAPFAAARSEINTLARLAETSAAQGAELTRERDVRRRAEEDAQLKQRLLDRSLDEKIRLGRDLHDGIIQSLYAVGLTLEAVRTLVKTDPAAADRSLEQTRDGINATIRDVRAYIAGLAPENLRRAGFAQALDTLLLELKAGRPARFEVTIDDAAAALLTPEQSLQALQIAREAVSNALRHGAASHLAVRLHRGDREIGLLVQDDGCGFDAAAPREGGHGVGNMRARAELVGAQLRVESGPGAGTRVVATFPIPAPPPL